MLDKTIPAFLRNRIQEPLEAAEYIQKGMTLAVGGYTSSGYPKAIPQALAKIRQGEDYQLRLLSGANVGPIDTLLAEAGLLAFRAPMIESKALAKQVNAGKVSYVEQQMSKMPRLIKANAFGKIDMAIVEALGITEEGGIIPTSSIGLTPYFLNQASKIIVEINTVQPHTLQGMHDVYLPASHQRQPIPLTGLTEKIGLPFIQADPQKIQSIVYCAIPDEAAPPGEANEETRRICRHLLDVLELEAKNYPGGILPPLQTGFGQLASAIIAALAQSSFSDLRFFCGGLQQAVIQLVAEGRVKEASTGSIQMTPLVMKLMAEHKELIRQTVVIRNADITNGSETTCRFAPITLTSGIEADIYGNVNSSHITGVNVVNGIGGGAAFAQNAGLSILLLQSEGKNGNISTIVPMVSHHDIIEHDIDMVITEHGVADLRGKDEVKRAQAIIANCASPYYREKLLDYLNRAVKTVGGHHPQILSEALSWHTRLQETGSMKW